MIKISQSDAASYLRCRYDVVGDCHLWNQCTNRGSKGYGQATINKVKMGAHRLAWIAYFGDIPDGMQVVNPEHLFLGDARSNAADKVAKGRQAKHGPEACRGLRMSKETAQAIIAMHQAGMKQKDIAAIVGFAQSGVSKVIHRKHVLSRA
jgi:hypothetical protein